MHPDWTTAITAWTRHLIVAATPPSTITLRTQHMRRIARELAHTTPATLTANDLIDWLGSQVWGPNTRKSVRSTLRAFYRWATTTGHAEASPADALPTIRARRPAPHPTPEDAYRAALAEADSRTHTALLLGGVCGLRRAEIARVHADDLDASAQLLRVTGKGGHVRLVPVTPDIAKTIADAGGWLFPSPQGGHLTPQHLAKTISRSLPHGYSTHSLRHRCGTQALLATGNLRAVQELLGHASPDVTAIYTHVPPETVRACVDLIR